MEILGVGPLEFVFILLIALVVVGPKEMINLTRKLAEFLRKIRNSEFWSTTREVMDMPSQIMKETGLEKEIREIQSLTKPPSAAELWQASIAPKQPVPPALQQPAGDEEKTPETNSDQPSQDPPPQE